MIIRRSDTARSTPEYYCGLRFNTRLIFTHQVAVLCSTKVVSISSFYRCASRFLIVYQKKKNPAQYFTVNCLMDSKQRALIIKALFRRMNKTSAVGTDTIKHITKRLLQPL
jgi:hypothetical protein